jgi:hypothetical protein
LSERSYQAIENKASGRKNEAKRSLSEAKLGPSLLPFLFPDEGRVRRGRAFIGEFL